MEKVRWPASPRAAGGLVVERRDGVQYAFPGRRTDVRFVVDDPRDRLDRHAGEFGDFADRRAAVSPHISPRTAMIAQDFARVRVLGAFSRGARGGTPRKKTAARGGTPRKKTAARGGTPRKKRDGSIAMPYGVATMCAHAGKSAPQAAPSAPPVARPHRARARPAHFVSGGTSEKRTHMIENK